jgi:hypothetical protein
MTVAQICHNAGLVACGHNCRTEAGRDKYLQSYYAALEKIDPDDPHLLGHKANHG